MNTKPNFDLGRVSRRVLAVTGLGALTACGGGGGGGSGGPPPAPPPPARIAETLVYVASDGVSANGRDELYAVADDGTGQRRLSGALAPSASRIRAFAVSPDAQWVAYIALEGAVDALWVAPIGGGTPVRVSRDVGSANRFVDGFAWSPDSRRIAYAANLDALVGAGGGRNFLANEVYVVNRDGTGEQKISGSIGSPAVVEVKHPQWSPDGRYVLQEVFRFDGDVAADPSTLAFALNVHDTATSGPNSRRLATTFTALKNVHWSPTSTRIAYLADQNVAGEYQLFVVDQDGANNVQLTQNGHFNSDAVWSPDGARLAYLDSQIQGAAPADLWVREGIVGETPIVLASPSARGRQVYDFTWSPDATRIAYVSDDAASGAREAYVVAADGTGAATKISGPLVASGDVFDLAWSPNGQRIAYLADQITDTVVDLFVSSPTGANTHVSTGLRNEEVDRFAWSRDGAVLAYTFGAAGRTVVPSGLRVSSGDGTNARIVSGALLTDIYAFAFAP